MERIKKIDTIKGIIMKYLVPKVEYDGMTAYELATIILRELEGEEDAVNIEEKNVLPEDNLDLEKEADDVKDADAELEWSHNDEMKREENQ